MGAIENIRGQNERDHIVAGEHGVAMKQRPGLGAVCEVSVKEPHPDVAVVVRGLELDGSALGIDQRGGSTLHLKHLRRGALGKHPGQQEQRASGSQVHWQKPGLAALAASPRS